MNTSIFLSFILLLPLIHCESNHHDDKDDPHWFQYLPSHVQNIVKSRRTTLAVSDEESPLNNQEMNTTELLNAGEAMDASVTPELMHGYGDTSQPNSVKIGVPVGSILLLILLCWCCYRCCCSRPSVSQGIVVQQPMQPPPRQEPNQPNIVIQHIHPTAQPQHAQPTVVQHVHHQHPPPQMQIQPPQFQQQPPYPTGYENRQMLEQEWSPHAPMNQPLQQYPAPDYPYNPSAPAPSYGKY